MKDHRFTGTGVAIVTPFLNQEIDFASLEKIINHVIDGGVDIIVALGSTGETATLSEIEERKILDFCIQKIDKRVPLMAGNFGGNNTQAILQKIKQFDFTGVDAVLSASPAYIKPTQDGIFRHYAAMADALPVPLMLYNVPGRTRSNMECDTTLKLASYSTNIIGIKEASADLVQITKILAQKPDHFIVMSGDDETALATIALGADGVISVMANALPSQFCQMVKSAAAFDLITARHINFNTFPVHHWLYAEGNPVGIKAALDILGFCSDEVRLPLVSMQPQTKEYLRKALDYTLKNS